MSESGQLPPRVVLEGSEYEELWMRLYVLQEGRCCHCGEATADLQLHHEAGRGLAGGFRRDVEEESKLLCRVDHPKWDSDRKPR